MKKSTLLFLALLNFCINSIVIAANLNPKGQGQALVYPYYTVNNDLNTLISVTNASADAKALKVRFLEGDNGQEVLIFNLYLGPLDVWTAALSATDSGAQLTTADTSCAPFLGNPQPFLPFAFQLDPGSDEEERERDGHIEIIEMGTVTDESFFADISGVSGAQRDCSSIADAWLPDGRWDTDPNDGLSAAKGLLFGNSMIVDVANGTAISYQAEAIDHFYTEGEFVHTVPSDPKPTWNSAHPQSVLIDAGQAITSDWPTGEDAISALFMHFNVINTYTILPSINAQTEWVFTFPTKAFYVNGQSTRSPFTALFDSPEGACERYEYSIVDQDSEFISTFGPLPIIPPDPPYSFCWNSNILHFYNSSIGGEQVSTSPVLGSTNIRSIDINPFTSGWFIMDFPHSESMTDAGGNFRYQGLPVIGFASQTYVNSNAQPGLLAQYATLFKHTYGTLITNISQ